MNFYLFCILLLQSVNGLGVMSIDMGSEWFKVAIVKPGVPMVCFYFWEKLEILERTLIERKDER